jgi:hypothetical protein
VVGMRCSCLILDSTRIALVASLGCHAIGCDGGKERAACMNLLLERFVVLAGVRKSNANYFRAFCVSCHRFCCADMRVFSPAKRN